MIRKIDLDEVYVWLNTIRQLIKKYVSDLLAFGTEFITINMKDWPVSDQQVNKGREEEGRPTPMDHTLCLALCGALWIFSHVIPPKFSGMSIIPLPRPPKVVTGVSHYSQPSSLFYVGILVSVIKGFKKVFFIIFQIIYFFLWSIYLTFIESLLCKKHHADSSNHKDEWSTDLH